jgi:hypothetical protein
MRCGGGGQKEAVVATGGRDLIFRESESRKTKEKDWVRTHISFRSFIFSLGRERERERERERNGTANSVNKR